MFLTTLVTAIPPGKAQAQDWMTPTEMRSQLVGPIFTYRGHDGELPVSGEIRFGRNGKIWMDKRGGFAVNGRWRIRDDLFCIRPVSREPIPDTCFGIFAALDGSFATTHGFRYFPTGTRRN